MIEFICGRAGSGKSEAVAERIRRALAAGRSRLILLVPEQQAVVWESRAARLLPPSAPLSLEIVNFRRLCNLVARRYGGITDRCITRGGKAALMWAALRSFGDAVSVGGRGVRAERVVPSLLSAVSEMKRCGVTPEALHAAADRLADEGGAEQLCSRARDLALLSAAYSRLLHEQYEDDEDELGRLADRLADEPFFEGTDVFVDSFFSLTPVENEILYQIFRRAENVTVTFACPPRDTGEGQFDPPRSFLTAMKRAADRAGRSYTVTTLTENHRAKSAPLAYLEAHLWDFAAPPYEADVSSALPDDPDSIRLIRAADRYAEADAAACRIAELVRGGARYGDIAVIARNADDLTGILDTALARRGIPFYFSERTDAASHPAARLLLTALAVISGGWRREDVIACVKTGFCQTDDDACDALEIYTETWHIRGARAFGEDWTMNPDGYVASWSTRARKRLADANRARRAVVPALSVLSDVFVGGVAPVREIARAAYEFLVTCGVWQTLADRAKHRAAAGRTREAAADGQMWDVLMDALDTLVDTLGESEADAAAFAALLRQVLSAADSGSIPGGIDEVTVGSADQVRLDETDHILLLGVIEGEFPRPPQENGFFTDTDKIRLEGEGIMLSADSDTRMREELLWFYRAASLPHRTLTVFCPQTSGGSSASPSLAAERITALFPRCRWEDSAAWDPARRIYTAADAAADAVRLRATAAGDALARLGVLPALLPPCAFSAAAESVSAETAAALFPGDISLTQTRLDSFLLCRFGYFCRFAAGLEEKKEAALTAVNVGTFVHRVFELFFDAIRRENRTLPLPEEELRALTDRIVTDVVAEICPDGANGGRAAYLFLRLKRCVLPMLSSLSREFAQSAFVPRFFELPVGTSDPAAVPAWRIGTEDGRSVSLRGTIDRLDTWREGDTTYVRVVDYKTGAKKFSADDIALGLNAQLLIYLFSVLHAPNGAFREALTGAPDGAAAAAGALYFSARPGENKSDVLLTEEEARALAEENVARSGVLLDDEAVLRAMEADLGGKYIPVKVKKDGSRSGTMSAASLAALESEMTAAVGRAADALARGRAEADPMLRHGEYACRYCTMREICRAAKNGKEDA